MDSLTQITLGAAVGEAVLGRQLGNRAIAWGAVFGTLPDMDMVLTPFLDSVQFIVYHRGLSHSLLGVAVASPVLSWAFTRWYRRSEPTIRYTRWLLFFLLVFLTHILLDCCTNYGTQVFAPFSDHRVAWNTIFIIDPLYTVPFSASVLACLFLNRTSGWRRTLNYAGLLVSTGYLALTLLNKHHVDNVVAGALARENIVAHRFMTCPTPLNSILWYVLAEDEHGYHVGFYSLLDSSDNVRFQAIPRRAELLGDLAGTYEVDRLIWFADGYYSVRPHTEGVRLHVMKFGKLNLSGEQELYPFTYQIHRGDRTGLDIERFEPPREESLQQLLARLWRRLKGI
jgi:inner membrane protein